MCLIGPGGGGAPCKATLFFFFFLLMDRTTDITSKARPRCHQEVNGSSRWLVALIEPNRRSNAHTTPNHAKSSLPIYLHLFTPAQTPSIPSLSVLRNLNVFISPKYQICSQEGPTQTISKHLLGIH